MTVELYRMGDSFVGYRKDKVSYIATVEKVGELGVLEGKM